MYRNQQNLARTNSNPSDNEEFFEFSGATLKITDDGKSPEADMGNQEVFVDLPIAMHNSAILSGLDDPTSPVKKELQHKPKEEEMTEKPTIRSRSAGEFFSLRPGQFQKAVTDCVNSMLRPAGDTNVLGSWLLTEVSHWDHERERIYILTSKTLVIVKYDFIALKSVQHSKIRIDRIDTVLEGRLTYPEASLVPRIEGITNGVTSLICGNLFNRGRSATQHGVKSARSHSAPPTCRLTVANRFDFTVFHPVEKKEFGVRVMWNRGRPLPLLTSWNPFAEDIPWTTVKNHPVFFAENVPEDFENNRHIYSIDSFQGALKDVFSNANPDSIILHCEFKDGPILMENYVGIGAVIHNKNNFGFFKVRGKFSF